MKTLMLSLALTAFLFSCDPNSNKQVGDADRFRNANANNGGGSAGGGTGTGGVGNNTGSSNTPTDAPLDGGLGILLVAGAAYGIKRVRNSKPKESA